jgi:hypothetical protein
VGCQKARTGAMAGGQGSAGHNESERAYQLARDGKVEGVISKSGPAVLPSPLAGEGGFERERETG